MKRWKSLKYVFLYGSCLTIGGFALLTIASLIPRKLSRSSPEICSETIYITGDWFHTNLVLPVKTDQFNWQNYLDLSEIGQAGGKYQYLSFGWGDREFYLNTPTLADVKLSTALQAFMIPTETVLHVQGYYSAPQDYPNYRSKVIKISTVNYLRLANYILNTFKNVDQTVQKISQSHRYSGSFYAAQGHYGIWQTCNDWIANGLREADLNTPLWSGLASSVIHHAKTRCQADH
ncbi:MAG: DUF2459 domain-containing protein [Prochlorotrichaceae cyanobacterium]|jgi:uncharacterized protein (TIGR02117 family)